jgi:predicted HicB family RNase H-like nuclease
MGTSKTDEAEDLVMLGVRVPEDLKRRIRVAAALNDQDMSPYVRDLLEKEVPHID